MARLSFATTIIPLPLGTSQVGAIKYVFVWGTRGRTGEASPSSLLGPSPPAGIVGGHLAGCSRSNRCSACSLTTGATVEPVAAAVPRADHFPCLARWCANGNSGHLHLCGAHCSEQCWRQEQHHNRDSHLCRCSICISQAKPAKKITSHAHNNFCTHNICTCIYKSTIRTNTKTYPQASPRNGTRLMMQQMSQL